MNLVIATTILAGLPVDQHWARHGQAAVSIAAWAVCAMLWMRSEPRTRRALAACLVIATLGEVFLSLGWGVYRYRLGNTAAPLWWCPTPSCDGAGVGFDIQPVEG